MKEDKERWMEEIRSPQPELQPVEQTDYSEERIKTLEKLLGCGDLAKLELQDLVSLFTPPRA